MDNAYDELIRALSTARAVRNAAKRHADAMVDLLTEPGVLQGVAIYRLKDLKKRLAGFNMQTGRWRKS